MVCHRGSELANGHSHLQLSENFLPIEWRLATFREVTFLQSCARVISRILTILTYVKGMEVRGREKNVLFDAVDHVLSLGPCVNEPGMSML